MEGRARETARPSGLFPGPGIRRKKNRLELNLHASAAFKGLAAYFFTPSGNTQARSRPAFLAA
jgi:hypothetical protein